MIEFDLKKSPIRKNINGLGEGKLSVFEDGAYEKVGNNQKFVGLQVRTILKDVENMLDVMENNEGKPMRIAIMGEVKAGKSTFINTLIGKKVAYTDVLEATAIVSEIKYSENEYVHLIGKDGFIAKEFTFEEMINWMEEMVDDEAPFSEYEKFVVGVHNDMLQNIIMVDTPGLLSITSKNHDITNKYIAETDYIFWIINSRNLGSKAVNDYIDKIHLTGKPIIGIVNKVDKIEEFNEIKTYIKEEYSSIFEETFFVSAQNGWTAIEKEEKDWEEKTGFSDVFDCIEEIGDDKESSTSRTLYYQLQRDKDVHIKMKERIQERKNHYDNEIAIFAHVNNEIKKSIHKELNRWYRNEFYVKERQDLLNASMQRFEILFNTYKDPAYLTELIDNKYNEITNFIYKKWDIIMTGLSINSSQVIVDFTYDKDVELNSNQDNKEHQSKNLIEKIKDGLTKGTALGITFAGYWAWLGPAANTATFIGSVVPVTVPFAIGGAAIAAIYNKYKVNIQEAENNKKKQQYVDDLYKGVKILMNRECKKMEDGLFCCSNTYYENKCKEYKDNTAQFNFDFTDDRFNAFMSELDHYIKDLDEAIQMLGKVDIPVPPRV